MDRRVRRLSNLKGCRIKSVKVLPTSKEGFNGDQMMVNGRLYVKDNNRWIDIAATSQIRNTSLLPYGRGGAISTSDAYMYAPGLAIFTSSKGYIMHKGGSIISHTTQVTITTATSGNVTFEVRVNDVNQSLLENEFASTLSTGEKSSYVSVDFGRVSFSAGDKISVKSIETGTMAWDETIGYFEVAFNS